MPWVILGRIPRLVGAQAAGAAEVEADAQAAGEAEAGAAGDEEAELVEAGDEEAELAADFSFPLVPPPRVTVMNAAPTAHPDPNNRDVYPYILGVHSACLLLNFGAEPFPGVYFGDLPFQYQSNLVVVRDFDMAGVELGHPPTATARAERIVPRNGEHAVVSNIESIGLLSTPTANIAKLVYIDADDDKWHQEDSPNPLPDHYRKWVPSGVVSHLDILWWFDLSWGLISYDPSAFVEVPFLLFHNLPGGRALDMAQPGIHDRRCITESQGELLYVEIIHDPDGDAEAAMVCMWTRTSAGGDDDNNETIGWHEEHAVTFEEIWNDDSYIETGLPRKVPVLVAVSPSRWDIVYFVLEEEERLFSVDLLMCTVFEYVDEEYDLVTPWPVPPSCRYVLPWSLPPQVAQSSSSVASVEALPNSKVENGSSREAPQNPVPGDWSPSVEREQKNQLPAAPRVVLTPLSSSGLVDGATADGEPAASVGARRRMAVWGGGGGRRGGPTQRPAGTAAEGRRQRRRSGRPAGAGEGGGAGEVAGRWSLDRDGGAAAGGWGRRGQGDGGATPRGPRRRNREALGIANSDDSQQLEVEIADGVAIDHEELQEAEIEEEEEMAMEIDAELQEELIHFEAELIAEAQAQAALKASANDEELHEADIDDGEQPQAEIHDDDLSSEEMLKLDMDLAVKMDPETASRLKAEVKEYFSDKDHHPGPSQDPEHNAGEDAI
ncbi:hypothetical protein SETIT_4G135500v2 [Setaria italica]|uniref:DUF1618 domain-containing protein n=1 Tax=Setaria italica TaxID=4555 RepID=A0A368QTU5_SETIT|nr:hypothetical protein SETIT_4G135500v2 [Setaria italica]